MSPRHSAKDTPQNNIASVQASRRPTLDLRYVTSLGCLGLLGGGAVFAQVGLDPLEMPIPSSEPTVSIPAPAPDLSGVPAEVIFDAPVYVEPEPVYVEPAPVYVEPEPVYVEPAPVYVEPEPVYVEPAPVYVEPEPVYVEPETPYPSVLDDLPAPAVSEPAYPHSYIDDTDYSLGATELYSDRDATVVLEDRTSGCASSLAPGQALTNGLCANAVFNDPAPIYTSDNRNLGDGYLGQSDSSYPSNAYADASSYGGANPASSANSANPVYSTGATVYPVNLSDRNSSFDPYTAAGLSYAQLEAQITRNIATMPLGRIGNGDRNLLFPVSVPSAISSFFGFRMHPIAQTQRLHTGTDIAAPYGTPVLAAFSGTVIESSDLGGYGLTVVLSHNEGTSETLYAHMSELLVNLGDEVNQGDPIGRVGSTGFSTGPHLHFEVKQMTEMGWVYLDANRQLEVALERLIDSSQLAQLPRREPSSL